MKKEETEKGKKTQQIRRKTEDREIKFSHSKKIFLKCCILSFKFLILFFKTYFISYFESIRILQINKNV